MSKVELFECVRLLEAADQILIRSGEIVLSAQLLSVLETLRRRAMDANMVF